MIPGEETYMVQPVGVLMRCPKCKVGEMTYNASEPVLMCNPPLYSHKCSICNYEAFYETQYPTVRFEPADLIPQET